MLTEVVPQETRGAVEARVKAGVTSLRGLPFLEPVDVEYLSPHQLTEYLEGLMGDEEREELRQLDELFTFLGLIDPDVDLLQLYLDLLSEGALGAYDTEADRLVVRLEGDAVGPSEELTLAHELTHALQQQHFDIDSLLDDASDNFDQALAITALAEGDATLTELQYQLENSIPLPDVPDLPVYESAPEVVQQLLLFPYEAGLGMIMANFGGGNWPGINAAYKHPPRSTEQVLHPEKYLDDDIPIEVALPEVEVVLGDGWSSIYSSVAGEFLLRHHLDSRLGSRQADRAASGWGGDRFALYGDSATGRLLLWGFLWDSPDDAEEFFDSYADFIEDESDWNTTVQEDDYLLGDSPGRWVHLRRSADHVALVIAPTEQLASQLSPLMNAP